MLVNLTEVFTSEEKVVQVTVPLEMAEFRSKSGTFQIIEKSPVQLTMSNLGVGKALVEGTAQITLMMECDRCLDPVPVKLELAFSREIASPDIADQAQLEENENILEGGQLNIETLMNNEILMNLPDKVLCKPDCKGICKQCGQNLNEGECGCDDFVPDPRMAAIKDIFNAKREV